MLTDPSHLARGCQTLDFVLSKVNRERPEELIDWNHEATPRHFEGLKHIHPVKVSINHPPETTCHLVNHLTTPVSG